MPEIKIRYKRQRTLQALKDFARYFDYSIVNEREAGNNSYMIGNVSVIVPSAKSDARKLKGLFSDSNLSLKEIRKKVWR
jgi:hypothetical protein